METKTYEDLLMEIEVYKQGAELAKRDADSMRAKINELNKSYFKSEELCREIDKAYEDLHKTSVRVQLEYPEWFKPLNVMETKINLYELQIKVMKDRIKELEN